MNIAILTYGRIFLKIKRVPEHYPCKFLFKILLVFVFIICFWNLFIDLESVGLCCRRIEKPGWTDRVRNEEESMKTEICYLQYTEERLTGFATYCVGTAF